MTHSCILLLLLGRDGSFGYERHSVWITCFLLGCLHFFPVIVLRQVLAERLPDLIEWGVVLWRASCGFSGQKAVLPVQWRILVLGALQGILWDSLIALIIHAAKRSSFWSCCCFEYWLIFFMFRQFGLDVWSVDRGDQVVLIHSSFTWNLMSVIWYKGGIICNSFNESIFRFGNTSAHRPALSSGGSCRC